MAERICGFDNWNGAGVIDDEESAPRAVRWATRELRRMHSPDWTKWHYTEGNGAHTACGQPVVLFVVDGSPETADIRKVDCKRCLNAMARPTGHKEST